MKFKWQTKKIANVTFHYCYVGEWACGLVVEGINDTCGWQSKLPQYPYGFEAGSAKTLSRAKSKTEAAIEEWFERTGLL